MSATAAAVRLRAPVAADRARVEAIVRATGLFRADEIPIALEVFDGSLAAEAQRGEGREPDYESVGAYAGDTLVGWVAFGPTPCTVGTYDCYWIAVDPARQGEGIGAQLMAAMEARLAGRARLLVVETAGRADYAPTRAFYARLGYQPVARIPEFYAPGDDQVVFAKSMSPGAPPREE